MEFRTCQRHWGAEYISDDVVRFRVWAEGQKNLTLRLNDNDIQMVASSNGWFQADVPGIRHGAEYQFVLQDGMTVPDPASRAQKGDVNGPSVVIDHRRYAHVNRGWKGRPWEETVIYELHMGTFTPEGTFRAAIDKLPYLAELGITQLEVMPVSQFGGSRGWGYDGVLLYAPHAAYGTPEDFHAFIDAAHGLGLHVHLTTEDSRNVIFLHPRDEQGNTPLFTAEWNDDFHNAAHVFATGETHAYYQDFAFEPEKKFARALAEGFVYQGEVSLQTGQSRGVECHTQPPPFFVDFIQNHDQTGNRAQGERLITLAGAEKTRVLLATLLLSPHIPLLFMGEEFGETHPFLFFTDFHGELAKAVREGRAKEFTGHAGHDETVPDPNDLNTFVRSTLDWDKPSQEEGKSWLRFTRSLLTLRHRHIVPLLRQGGTVEGKILHTAHGRVAVSWQFPQGTLSLALNIGKKPAPMPELAGETLFSWPETGDILTPNSIVVRFADGEAAL